MKTKGYKAGGKMKTKGYKAGGKLPMVKDPKTGKMIPAYAADGKGKMMSGGPVKKMKTKGYAKGGMMKSKGMAKGGAMKKKGYSMGGAVSKKATKPRGVGAATRGYGKAMK